LTQTFLENNSAGADKSAGITQDHCPKVKICNVFPSSMPSDRNHRGKQISKNTRGPDRGTVLVWCVGTAKGMVSRESAIAVAFFRGGWGGDLYSTKHQIDTGETRERATFLPRSLRHDSTKRHQSPAQGWEWVGKRKQMWSGWLSRGFKLLPQDGMGF